MRGELETSELLTDSLEAYFGGGRGRGALAVYGAGLACLCGAGLLLAVVRVDVTARAPGLLRPALERHRVAAGAAGIVESVTGRPGARMHAGDLLLVLRPDALAPRLAAAESTATELGARAADLAHLIRHASGLVGDGNGQGEPRRGGNRSDAGKPTGAHSASSGAGTASRGHERIGASDRLAAPAQLPRLARYREDRDQLRHEWTDLAHEEQVARGEAARVRALGRLGLAAPTEIEQAELRLTRARAAPRQLAERQRASWAQELEEVLTRLREAEAERTVLRAQARLNEVRAPVSGTVEEWSPLSPGSWVAAGETIAVISPDAPLVAEIYVDSRDAARVRPGMPVRLLLDAFDHHEWGALPARVSEVADDYTLVGGRPVFRVRCQLLSARLRRPDGGVAQPGKGMSLTAAFILGRRTLLHLMWDRASRPFEAGAGEPGAAPSPDARVVGASGAGATPFRGSAPDGSIAETP